MVLQNMQEPITRLTFEANKLATSFPPVFHHAKKRMLYVYVCPDGTRHSGELSVTRWLATAPPSPCRTFDFRRTVECRADFYDYEPPTGSEPCVEWYVNFSHYDIFCSYGLGVFAQDEIQVAEHPILASLREALAAGSNTLTVESGAPTPILIMGAERLCSIDTRPDAAAGRPSGLYGRLFAKASEEAIRRSVTILNTPTVTNLIAMVAPSGGRGLYTEDQIRYILTTAYTGFRSARQESCFSSGSQPAVVVHTGYWGCGAYGGNRVLMATLQILAASLSGLDHLVFHTGDVSGADTLKRVRDLLAECFRAQPAASGVGWARSLLSRMASRSTLRDADVALTKIIATLLSKEFRWGVNDGN